jgi:hypothetical protein
LKTLAEKKVQTIKKVLKIFLKILEENSNE